MDRSMSLDTPTSGDLSASEDDHHYAVSPSYSSSPSPDPRGAFYRANPRGGGNPSARASDGSRSALVDAHEEDRTCTSSDSSSDLGAPCTGRSRGGSRGAWRSSSRGKGQSGDRHAGARHGEMSEPTRLDAEAPDEFRSNPFVGADGASGGGHGLATGGRGGGQRIGRFTLKAGPKGGEVAGEARRRRDERPGRSEQSSCSDRSTVVQEEQEMEMLKRQVSDLGKQLWQMHKAHEKEKSEMVDDFEFRLKEAQGDNEAMIGKLREQLQEKDRGLKESRQRVGELEWQVEDLQLKMQNALGGRPPYGMSANTSSPKSSRRPGPQRRTESSEGIMRSHSETQMRSHRERGMPPRSLTESNMSSGDFSQGRALDSYSEAVPHLPPKHLQQFSPLTMRRRMWNSARGVE